MNDINLKNKLLKELVSKKSLDTRTLLEIFEGNQEELNFLANEFGKYEYAKLVSVDQIGVVNMEIMHEGVALYRNGGFKK